MDDLTIYVIKNYSNLMTSDEHKAYTLLLLEEKNSSVSRVAIERFTNEWGVDGAFVKSLLERGHREFLTSIRDRILKDSADRVVLNRCAKCSSLTRTPLAKQCLSCGHDWH